MYKKKERRRKEEGKKKERRRKEEGKKMERRWREDGEKKERREWKNKSILIQYVDGHFCKTSLDIKNFPKKKLIFSC